jgi:hypothetical protein
MRIHSFVIEFMQHSHPLSAPINKDKKKRMIEYSDMNYHKSGRINMHVCEPCGLYAYEVKTQLYRTLLTNAARECLI